MAFFHSFTDSIRQKWLQFFQANRDWITLHMEVESVYTPDGGKRPSSYLILGVVNALEPKLAQLMLPFSRLNPDADTLIEVLDLHFDPDIALGNRFIPKAILDNDQDDSSPAIDENSQAESLTNSHTNGFAALAELAIAPDTADQTLSVSESPETQNGLGDISLSNGHHSLEESPQEPSLDADGFGEVSFEAPTISEPKQDDQILDDLNSPDENAFSDVLSDVWGDETALQKSEENNDFLGEELPAGVFDESEIARLFPNS
ncbi:DUF5331 domain-containing protein [Calothrix sp. PCC 7507]|uniref:DUF5331 domain-containing protein n=1 Tax=Calothrix sp. PCC 7507 TaxID=99598 RepID=UPI00029F3623|nr:DUF5331 domain-containing protein [Calothrix sp. PCC 7507]AFY33925.1 hypothetical protein Cal7507_3532 [Calothrix sp. PCC 7507]